MGLASLPSRRKTGQFIWQQGRRPLSDADDVAPDRAIKAPFHSITSSARARSDGGTVRPSALAVLRLITNSYLVGDCTGRSPGFSPLRMRSTKPAARRY